MDVCIGRLRLILCIALLCISAQAHANQLKAIHNFSNHTSNSNVESDVSAKWEDLLSRIRTEEETVTACRADISSCSGAARLFFEIVERGRGSEGRARLGEINRAINLLIKPVSDWIQHGVDDFWSAPLATLGAGAGDCEDYAILKYAALRELGIASRRYADYHRS